MRKIRSTNEPYDDQEKLRLKEDINSPSRNPKQFDKEKAKKPIKKT